MTVFGANVFLNKPRLFRCLNITISVSHAKLLIKGLLKKLQFSRNFSQATTLNNSTFLLNSSAQLAARGTSFTERRREGGVKAEGSTLSRRDDAVGC